MSEACAQPPAWQSQDHSRRSSCAACFHLYCSPKITNPSHLCERLDRSFMLVSPTRRLACPVVSRDTTSSTVAGRGQGKQNQLSAAACTAECPTPACRPASALPLWSQPPAVPKQLLQPASTPWLLLTAVHLPCRQAADVLPLQVLPHLQVGARGVQQVRDGLQVQGQEK